MGVYRARMDDAQPVPQSRPLEHSGRIPSLAAQLGLEDEMELEERRSSQRESVESEFSRYANGPSSIKEANILNFWAVGTIMPYK
jgi:hypothetical protein